MHQKQKPTALQKQQYKTLTAILNTQVIAVKLDLKLRVKKTFYRAHGLFLEQGTNIEYKDLQKKLDHTKKLCQCWEDCIAM